MNDFSSGIMTASAGDDNSTKELKGFVFLCLKLLNEMTLKHLLNISIYFTSFLF